MKPSTEKGITEEIIVNFLIGICEKAMQGCEIEASAYAIFCIKSELEKVAHSISSIKLMAEMEKND